MLSCEEATGKSSREIAVKERGERDEDAPQTNKERAATDKKTGEGKVKRQVERKKKRKKTLAHNNTATNTNTEPLRSQHIPNPPDQTKPP